MAAALVLSSSGDNSQQSPSLLYAFAPNEDGSGHSTSRGPQGWWEITVRQNLHFVIAEEANPEVEALWDKMKAATEAGLLGPESSRTKQATRMKLVYKAFARCRLPEYFFVIKIKTPDAYDKAANMNVREELRRLGVTQVIPYMKDEFDYNRNEFGTRFYSA